MGTPDVESMTSYFCRLAHSHGTSIAQLSRWILERFGEVVPERHNWYQLALISPVPETELKAAWLAELTGVEGLDTLTLLPWQHTFSTQGLISRAERWCPCCFADDLHKGVVPYFRLAWELATVTVCLKHKAELAQVCPHCAKSHVRHRAAVVVPGYCTACGGFLGGSALSMATPEALWVARQIGLMLATQESSSRTVSTQEILKEVVLRMEGGNISRFAKQLGLSKSGVWYWLNKGGQPGIAVWLAISLYGGISLDRLLLGELDGWVPPVSPQLQLPLPTASRKKGPSRELDWAAIKCELRKMLETPEIVTLNEASRRVGVDAKVLYHRANGEVRAITARYRQFEVEKQNRRVIRLRAALEQLQVERLEQGYDGLSARDVRSRLAGSDLASSRNLFRLIRRVRDDTDR